MSVRRMSGTVQDPHDTQTRQKLVGNTSELKIVTWVLDGMFGCNILKFTKTTAATTTTNFPFFGIVNQTENKT